MPYLQLFIGTFPDPLVWLSQPSEEASPSERALETVIHPYATLMTTVF